MSIHECNHKSLEVSRAVVVGSSRQNGNTHKLASYVADAYNGEVFDLNRYQVLPFDYQAEYDDDFLEIMQALVNVDIIYIATPMYWYSASAQMKAFIDRLSDLLKTEKALGRQLRGKQVGILASGCDREPPACFEQMFQLTFAYLGMRYVGMMYCACPNDFILERHQADIDHFLNDLEVM